MTGWLEAMRVESNMAIWHDAISKPTTYRGEMLEENHLDIQSTPTRCLQTRIETSRPRRLEACHLVRIWPIPLSLVLLPNGSQTRMTAHASCFGRFPQLGTGVQLLGLAALLLQL